VNQPPSPTPSGILLLDKPAGITSNAALSRAKRVLGIRKAGHTGALDPLATGLLPLCFGEATKVAAFLLDADKQYLADVRLGQRTASGDAEGEVLESVAVPGLDEAVLEPVLERFRGEIDQIPPMYSALKHNGKRLHELARAGVEVERKPRRVTIHCLELLDYAPDRLTLRVACSKGTYIRSLAMDIGEALGCGAHLVALRRERSGPFGLDNAIALQRIEELDQAAARALLIPPEQVLIDLPAIRLTAAQARDIGHGKAVRLDPAPGPADPVRMFREARFLGLGWVDATGLLRVRRLFQ